MLYQLKDQSAHMWAESDDLAGLILELRKLSQASQLEYAIHSEEKLIISSAMFAIEKFLPATELILRFHKDQVRKGDGHPYLEHPLGVATVLWQAGVDSESIVAAVCHDLLEDTECTAEQIESACGKQVLSIVEALTNDSTLSDKTDWEEKKVKYIASVGSFGKEAIVVSVADKICNLRSFLAQYKVEGKKIWRKFNRGRLKNIWFAELELGLAKKVVNKQMYNDLAFLIKELKMTEE